MCTAALNQMALCRPDDYLGQLQHWCVVCVQLSKDFDVDKAEWHACVD